MPAEFESGVFTNNESAWHKLGVVLEEKLYDVEKALELSGMDWTVAKESMYIKQEDEEDGGCVYKEVPNQQAIVRQDTQAILGTCGTRYQPLQNSELFYFFEPLLKEQSCFITSAISLVGGSRVAVVAQVEDNIREIVPGDNVENYLILTTSHDGNASTKVKFSNKRPVCMNTLAAALLGSGDVRSIRHTASQQSRLAAVQRAVDLYRRKIDEETDIYRQLAGRETNLESFRGYLETLFSREWNYAKQQLGSDEVDIEQIRGAKKCLNNFMYSTDLLLDNVKDTAWAAFNAVTEFATHQRTSSYEKNINSLWFGSQGSFLDQAKELALSL